MRTLSRASAVALLLSSAQPACAEAMAAVVRSAPLAPVPVVLRVPVLSMTAPSLMPLSPLNSAIPVLPRAAIPTAQPLQASLMPAARSAAHIAMPAALAAIPLAAMDATEQMPWARDAGASLFDGAGAASALGDLETRPVSLPAGALSVNRVRLDSPQEAAQFIPHAGNTEHFLAELKKRWDTIGSLDLHLYRDAQGGYFRAVDVSKRPDLVDRLPEVGPSEAVLIKKIMLHTDDLQLIIREAGKTPDLIVSGVVTEMKSLERVSDFASKLSEANTQLISHQNRHQLDLGSGAVAVDMLGWGTVPGEQTLSAINKFVSANKTVGFRRVEVYAGDQRSVFLRGRNDRFSLQGERRSSGRSFMVPNSMAEAQDIDAEAIFRESVEPIRMLKNSQTRATITVYGAARILSPEAAKAALKSVEAEVGSSGSNADEKKRLGAAREAVSLSKYYEIARRLGGLIAKKTGGSVAVVTGGGPGIMEAANRGAFEAGGPSVGFNIKLDHEQALNPYVTPGLSYEFQHFPTRKAAMRHGSMGLAYFPGGFGTMDELFEILTLMQTKKIKRVPIVLVGPKDYWDNIIDFKEFSRRGLIREHDLSLFRFVNTAEDAWRALSKPLD
ncbi:MAG: TIGR00730 family Rossman fold protein [Elusimicrobiota bacterium]